VNHVLVELIRAHAKLNYATYGWSEVVECWDDADIAYIIGDATTSDVAIRRMADVVEIRQERYRDAVGPVETCAACGGTFNANQVCTRCL
jgi:hypothetical protein